MSGHIFQLSSSAGGVPKLAVPTAELTLTGFTSDKQAHRRFHGGPERAVCLYALERILELQAEGHPIYPGSTGENVTVAGIDWTTLQIGSRLALGDEVILEIAAYTVPCNNIAGSFQDGFFNRILHKKYPGYARLYARVIQTGHLAVGQPVEVLPALEPVE